MILSICFLYPFLIYPMLLDQMRSDYEEHARKINDAVCGRRDED